jgi:hypothetical protein
MIDLGEGFEGWISVFEGMFLVEPCQSIVTQVKFNSAGLDFGTYTGSVIFNNNSSTPVVTVPVTLIVEQDCLLPLIEKLIHYYGVKGCEFKLRSILKNFQPTFTRMGDYINQLNQSEK